MHDPVDIRRRIDRLLARVDRRDDYGQLLASGQVIHEVEDVDDIEAWRAEIRRQARADEIKVRTGCNEGIVSEEKVTFGQAAVPWVRATLWPRRSSWATSRRVVRSGSRRV